MLTSGFHTYVHTHTHVSTQTPTQNIFMENDGRVFKKINILRKVIATRHRQANLHNIQRASTNQ